MPLVEFRVHSTKPQIFYVFPVGYDADGFLSSECQTCRGLDFNAFAASIKTVPPEVGVAFERRQVGSSPAAWWLCRMHVPLCRFHQNAVWDVGQHRLLEFNPFAEPARIQLLTVTNSR